MNRILLVDDEKGITFAMSHYFRRYGFDVDCAADSQAARLFLSERRYALAIVDIHLAGRAGYDGLDLAESIRRDHSQTVVMVMTALGTPDLERRAADIGVQSFVRKPARLADVAEAAFRLLGLPPASASQAV